MLRLAPHATAEPGTGLYVKAFEKAWLRGPRLTTTTERAEALRFPTVEEAERAWLHPALRKHIVMIEPAP